MTSPRLAAVALSLLAVAACGTTVPVTSSVSNGPGLGDGLTAGQAGGTGAAAPGGTSAQGPAGATSSSPSLGSAVPRSGASSPVTAATGAPSSVTTATGRVARGVTNTTIKIGVFYASDGKEAVGALGGTADRGNEKAAYDAIFADINEHGGIAGRKVLPVYYMLEFGDQRPRDQQEQPACQHFTADNKVFAVLTTKSGGATDSFKACLERAGVVHIAGNFTVAGETTYRQFRHYVEPDGLGVERSAVAMPPSLAERKWLTPWNASTGQASPAGEPKIGVITADYPTFQRAVDSFLLPAFKAVGGKVEQVVRVSMTSQGAATSAISNAVLSFRSRGVTHVAFLQSAGAVPLLFLQAASQQAYYPRYAFTSQDVMPLLHESGLIPNADRAFNGALGVGWWPSADTTYGKNEYAKSTAAKACLALLSRKDKAPTSALQETLAYFHCDVVATLKAGIEAGGPAISPDSFLLGLDRAGKQLGAAGTPRSLLSSARRDGVTAVRGFAWSPPCSCFVHDGPLRQVV